nr:hypothetical protein [Bacilli bacterium]
DIGDNVYYLGLGTVISLDDSNPLMSSLKDKTIGEIPDAIKDLTINDVFTYSDFDSLPPILQTLLNRKTKITDLEDAVKSLQLQDVVNIKKKEDGTYDESDPMYPLRECGLSSDSIWNKIKTEYTIDMFVDVDESSPYFLKQLVNEHVAIGDLSTTLNTWKLNKFIEITSSSPKMLQFLQDYTLSELSTTNFMETMTIGDVLTDTELSASKFLTLIPSTTLITGIGGAIDGIKILDLFEDQIYQEDGGVLVVNATWKYMLIESDETFPTGTLTKASEPFVGKKCENYTIGNSMNQMVENMKNNIGRASMFNLTGDGLVSLTSEATAFLNTYIAFYPDSVAEARYKAEWAGKKYGDLPIDIFVDLMINNLP